MTFKIGDKVSLPEMAMTSDKTFNLADYKGKNIIFYFYPKDSTPGCTIESVDFTEHYDRFLAADAVVFGLSKDTLASHEKFKAKFNMPFELIADVEKTFCDAFGVMKEKNMFGKKYMGIERSTFVMNSKGELVKEWRKVKVPTHVEAVLEYVKAL